MNLKESICQILSDQKAKREGLHVKYIARHIFNNNYTLFSAIKILSLKERPILKIRPVFYRENLCLMLFLPENAEQVMICNRIRFIEFNF
jgi:hypothetical protein